MREKVFNRSDYVCGVVATLVSFAVYAFTAAPNVTLLDSGEFLVAAQHFGVPHPTGYPLWTFLSWLFQLLPLGSGAWEVALFSGICAALSVGLCALMASGIGRWMFGPSRAAIVRINALLWPLLFAFSQSQWSQAVIAEVYALHALLSGFFLLRLYLYIRQPDSIGRLLWCFFALTLAFSNHQLAIVFTPLPFLAVLLLRRALFWDLTVFSLLTGVLFYLAFGILSNEPVTLTTSLRFFYFGLTALAILLWVRRLRVCWPLMAFLPFVAAFGLLPYVYLPIASGTNPPMNWSYAREPEGFFYSFNRSQYGGRLSEQLIRTVGRVVGTSSEAEARRASSRSDGYLTPTLKAQLWIGFFWQKLLQSFTVLGALAFLAAFIAILRLSLPARTWIYLLTFAFVLAAFLQPIMDGARIDLSGWWLQMPYHTYTNLVFALLCSVGMTFVLGILVDRRPILGRVFPVLLLLPLWTLYSNYASCSQRDRWFGWQYGYDMLKDLPKDAVFFGGSDPGRFVPTYMVFGESGEEPRSRRDPSFDRRDLYVITQNALGDNLYQKYLRDHYTESRPPVKNAFEQWLGRENQYPREPLVFPSSQQATDAGKALIDGTKSEDRVPGWDDGTLFHSGIAKWVFEKNKDKHQFFIEQSFPMRWSYDYAIPHGLIYRLANEPIKELSAEDVQRDTAFWKDYTARLLATPGYTDDFDAQRSFSRLRMSIGDIYNYRKMYSEAEHAYRQAIELWPANSEAIAALTELFWKQNEYDKPVELFDRAMTLDPNNFELGRLANMASLRRDLQGEIESLEKTLATNPQDREALSKLFQAFEACNLTNGMDSILDRLRKAPAPDVEVSKQLIAYYFGREEFDRAGEISDMLIKVEPMNGWHHYVRAQLFASMKDYGKASASVQKAMELGGLELRERFRTDPAFKELREEIATGKLAPPAGNP